MTDSYFTKSWQLDHSHGAEALDDAVGGAGGVLGDVLAVLVGLVFYGWCAGVARFYGVADSFVDGGGNAVDIGLLMVIFVVFFSVGVSVTGSVLNFVGFISRGSPGGRGGEPTMVGEFTKIGASHCC